ncbi:hypothetical protein TMEC54S_00251 [Thauera mechernichensis]|uniref:hypothetical protein n=1 Tax=Thauera sp. 27 TaxID=305700 RepID=UPI0002CDBA14|nr:hypothetical protein [Thauera sp. 27]ENO78008.1 hypothetical protein B447_14884 [Thauera sp. 27]
MSIIEATPEVTRTRKFDFYADPGHGWLAVKRTDLQKAGVADRISRCSYQREDMVFLEEDCDAGIFIKALAEQGIKAEFRQHHTDRSSKIRGYASYAPQCVTLDLHAGEYHAQQCDRLKTEIEKLKDDLAFHREQLSAVRKTEKSVSGNAVIDALKAAFMWAKVKISPAAGIVYVTVNVSAEGATRAHRACEALGFERRSTDPCDVNNIGSAKHSDYRKFDAPTIKLYLVEEVH